jgi:imidazoleglycerol phosphate dehydratase HisB
MDDGTDFKCGLNLSGRPYMVYDPGTLVHDRIGYLETELLWENSFIAAILFEEMKSTYKQL